ncbi:hypothetical protein GCM10023340_21180 [Nocardioides marinquilinus]|uniref:DUF3017 domain-containing protein n=1 Tax=Nocardioides marinquilinus TaxID=1210400 RepID=A0ABP9PK27_9ACTN
MSDPPEGLETPDPPEQPRRYPSTVGGAFYLCVLITAGVAIGIVTTGDWRAGLRVLSAGLVAAGVLRLLLPQRDAGMLAVRHRLVDTTLLIGVAVAFYLLAGSIPDQPT